MNFNHNFYENNNTNNNAGSSRYYPQQEEWNETVFYNSYDNSNFNQNRNYQQHQQNNFQQSYSAPNSNYNHSSYYKRPYENQRSLSGNGSPEPKRQLQKQNSYESLQQNSNYQPTRSANQLTMQQQSGNRQNNYQNNQPKSWVKNNNQRPQQNNFQQSQKSAPSSSQQFRQPSQATSTVTTSQFKKHFPYAAHQAQVAIQTQTPIHLVNQHKKPFNQQPNQKSPQKKNRQTQNEHPILKIQAERQKDWEEKLQIVYGLLGSCPPGEEVQVFLTYLQTPRALWERTQTEIKNDLFKYLSPMGVADILTFGSTLTGLDFHGSDLDFYVQLKNPPTNEDETRIIISRAAKLARMLQGSDFMIICTIQNARVPLIRLLHRSTKVTCDVNFTSKFGRYNSQFIGHTLGYDKRIKHMAVILKLWSKSYKLASQMVISNYCLMMLLIFYLQNLETPMLETILKNQSGKNKVIIDNTYQWNFYFNPRMNNCHGNHQTLRELLIGFFDFYSKINHKESVVSLFTGTLIKREEFATHPMLEESRQLIESLELTPMKCENADFFHIQDGFELNLNIGIKVKKNVDFFFELIKLSLAKCQELSDKPFSELLHKLLTDVKVPVVNPEGKKKKTGNKFEMKIYPLEGDLKQCQDLLLAQDSTKIYNEEDRLKFFYEHTVEYTKKFLEEVYLCMIIPEEVDRKKMFTSRFKIVLHVDTINGRKKISFKDENAVKNERILSMKISEKKIRFDLDVQMMVTTKDKGKGIEFEIYDNTAGGKTPLQNFGSYFAINIFPALRYYLKKRLDKS